MGLYMRLHILAAQAQIELLLPRVSPEHLGLLCRKGSENVVYLEQGLKNMKE